MPLLLLIRHIISHQQGKVMQKHMNTKEKKKFGFEPLQVLENICTDLS